jgi:hypothetical protein
MNCKNCHKTLSPKTGGFVLCESCGTVNVSSPNNADKHVLVSGTLVATQQHRRKHTRRVGTKLIFVTIPILTVLVTGALYFQSSAPSYGGKSNLSSMEWHEAASELQQARQLVAQSKFDEATLVLSKIDKSYPAYAKVVELQKTIAEKQAVIKAASVLPAPTPAATAPKKTARPPATFTTSITIRGDAACQATTLSALKLLHDQAPTHYATVTTYMGIIECLPQGSGMYAYENPPRYVVGDATRNAGTVWYAGTIAHDAGHSKLYHDYLSAHPGQAVPNDVWTGQSAEAACLDAQYDALSKIGATQSQLDYIKSVINTQYWNIPYAQRWW